MGGIIILVILFIVFLYYEGTTDKKKTTSERLGDAVSNMAAESALKVVNVARGITEPREKRLAQEVLAKYHNCIYDTYKRSSLPD